MKKTIALCSAALLLLFVAACDDNTGSIGISITPSTDSIAVHTRIFHASSRSVLADSVLGRTSTVYFGRYTDPETNTIFESNFMTQFNCAEGGNVFPAADSIRGDSTVKTELRLFYTSWFGDKSNAMQLEVFLLDNPLLEGRLYYTNVNPADYCDVEKEPIAVKSYTAMDYALDDDVLEDEDHYHNVCIPLPNEIGNNILKEYRAHPEYFDGASSFIDNVCQGVYVRCTQGDGTVLNISQISLNVSFVMASNDSVYTTQFMGSQEVLQVNSFHNDGLQPLVEDNECTWLKTPAGIFTEITLPIDEITAEDDTINSAKMVFTRYNRASSEEFHPGIPQTLLMVRKTKMTEFFANNELTDNETSVYTSFNSTYNTYTFGNIANIISNCKNERDEWLEEHPSSSTKDYEALFPDWNRVLLIPISLLTTTSNNVTNTVGIRHDLSIGSTCLANDPKHLEVRVITSAFH